MRASKFLAALAFAVAFGLVTLAGTGVARADDFDGGVHFSFTPYVWLPTINGTFRYSLSSIVGDGGPIAGDVTQTVDSRVGPNQYLANLNFALMGNAVLRKGALALYVDALNANVSGAAANTAFISGPGGNLNVTIATHETTQIVTTLITAAPMFTVFHYKGSSVNVLAGGQWLTTSANASLSLTGPMGNTFSGAVGGKQTVSEFIAGLAGSVDLGGHWSVPYLVDGGWGTPSSWQYIVGLHYGSLGVNWRYLQFNAGSSTALIQSLKLGGPALSYTLHF